MLNVMGDGGPFASREWDEAVASMAICEEATIVFSAGASARMQMPFIGARKAPPRTANPDPDPSPSPSPSPNPSPSPSPSPSPNPTQVDRGGPLLFALQPSCRSAPAPADPTRAVGAAALT